MEEGELREELKEIKEGLISLGESLKEFVSNSKSEFATLRNGDKEIQLASSKLTTQQLIQMCKYVLDNMEER